ncbi:SDR family NAD(P)-dependent oxidoreductase [Streptomyces sp. NPDC057950]|uniref:SDR family NAD(P)-dependent oxidoreductase n=1 Tax=Streptomyces sp. NPDC057950 TaxID=3346288 RepID=UPI0036E86C3B
MELKNKTALITGAGAVGGIGAEIARVLAEAGASVVVSGRHAARGEEVVKEVVDKGGNARFVLADLENLDDVARLAQEAGAVDILVNNAAALTMGPTVEQELEGYERVFDVNVRATYFLTAKIAPAMVAKGEGSIINLSSLAGKLAMPGMSVYGATKAAIESLTRNWAEEWSASGVRVNAIAPGTVNSEFVSGALGAEVFEFLRQEVPNKRIGTTNEIAQAVLFLASDKSSFITGATIAVDGGRTIR